MSDMSLERPSHPEVSPQLPRCPDVSQFMDYRLYLKEYYNFRRAQSSKDIRPYSYAVFAAAADIKSPNYLKLVIDGQRNLSDGMAEKFARAMGLAKIKHDEFRVLVRYTQAHDPVERSQYLKELSDVRVRAKMVSGEINSKTWDSIPGWISWILLQLVEIRGIQIEPISVARLLNGKVSAEVVRRALNGLIESGMLERDAMTGEITKTKQLIESPREMPPDMVRKLQTELILLGLDSLFKDAPKNREFGTLTLSLTRDEFEKLKFELKHLRKRWQREFTDRPATEKNETLYQFNIQLFPLSEEVVSRGQKSVDSVGNLAKSDSAQMERAQEQVEKILDAIEATTQESLDVVTRVHDIQTFTAIDEIVPYSSKFLSLQDDSLPPHALYTPGSHLDN